MTSSISGPLALTGLAVSRAGSGVLALTSLISGALGVASLTHDAIACLAAGTLALAGLALGVSLAFDALALGSPAVSPLAVDSLDPSGLTLARGPLVCRPRNTLIQQSATLTCRSSQSRVDLPRSPLLRGALQRRTNPLILVHVLPLLTRFSAVRPATRLRPAYLRHSGLGPACRTALRTTLGTGLRPTCLLRPVLWPGLGPARRT
ncbi:hypothetical protein, partial [Actinokineospora pegani]|uniref:hypothetical protein n=1 Tax=Actinokineospora pegani TaxID=2654637 RepID=UPI0012EAE000